ncbi:Myrosinase-binding protein [Thalictrum thalictroides]|uniref:Myrosinase-binding protein n=1 Tax=Thalictrum thalictroides TaxID=46969 RepID=A0A7J6WP16_THATH|nr:Myrosinase-binding protein [Thalictrum thalictroides]
MADCIEEKDKDMAKRILIIALNCMEFSSAQRPSMSDVVRLLEGTKDPPLPSNPNRFLSSDSSPSQASSSSSIVVPKRNLELESVVVEEISNPHDEKEKEIQFKTLGPWGGLGGDEWDDGVFPGILQIEIISGRREICSIEIEYCGYDGMSVGWSDKHGRNPGHQTENIVFDYPSEYLMGITGFSYDHGTYANSVAARSISFITNKKIHGPYGVNLIHKGDPFTSGKLGKVVGFHGRSGAWVNAIGVHMEDLGI